MGVRHRQHTVEAVQYHPESVMSEGGRGLMANFLKMKGGDWGGENAWCGVSLEEEVEDTTQKPSTSKQETKKSPSLPTILNQIHAQRLLDVEASSSSPSTTPANVQQSLSLHTAPPLISFLNRIKTTPHTAIMAEVKRASPSKGDIAPLASAPAQGLKYALAGASVISVLTEPKWFKGSLTDLLAVRMAVDSLPNRPAILRKDFILSTYQIDEARLYGADTILLIVAMLAPDLLRELYDYSISLGMEPLVEVNNPAELEIALEIGSKIIGVNNRNLHDFNVDMSTTTRVNSALKNRDVILCALSGISSRKDVEAYVADGVRAVLVGESLMRAEDTQGFLRELIGLSPLHSANGGINGGHEGKRRPMVKICGVRSKEDAKMICESGADLVGMILVPGAKRRVSLETAREISEVVRAHRRSLQPSSLVNGSAKTNGAAVKDDVPSQQDSTHPSPETWFTHHYNRLLTRPKPLLVAVFQNQSLTEILDTLDQVDIDIVQLHGDEPQSWAQFIPKPIIKVFKVDSTGIISGGEIKRAGLNGYVLLDAAPSSSSSGVNGITNGGGGEGKTFPWEHAKKTILSGQNGTNELMPILLAGGLTPENVGEAVMSVGEGIVCVDVSSGVESGDGKDRNKVERFIKAVKG